MTIFPMETEFWRCQPESEPWWGPGTRFGLVDPGNERPAHTVSFENDSPPVDAIIENKRETASFRFFPIDHNAALTTLVVSRRIPLSGQKWCEGFFHSKKRTRLVFVELKNRRKARIRQPMEQLSSVLSFFDKHLPLILQKAKWKRAIVSNRRRGQSYMANTRNAQQRESFRKRAKEFRERWNVKLEVHSEFVL